ncbi:hypothetical protein PR048_025840 [Dryococelus australis]|uniref:Uncharacterized protein n=1 Tax=Dryococelus australis TaxID=614101 RepID=A0ABQ9GJN0_9NEOP|nr:hypothetical protein PR048_025840 [Dryococelus australis]
MVFHFRFKLRSHLPRSSPGFPGQDLVLSKRASHDRVRRIRCLWERGRRMWIILWWNSSLFWLFHSFGQVMPGGGGGCGQNAMAQRNINKSICSLECGAICGRRMKYQGLSCMAMVCFPISQSTVANLPIVAVGSCDHNLSMHSASWNRTCPLSDTLGSIQLPERAYIRQKAKSKYRNRKRLERASQNQSSDTHKTPYYRMKRCRERKINIKASERVNVDAGPKIALFLRPKMKVVSNLRLLYRQFVIHVGVSGRCVGVVERIRTSLLEEPGSIPSVVAPGFSQMGIVPDDATGRRPLLGYLPLPRPCISAPLHTRLTSPSSALKTSLIRTAGNFSTPLSKNLTQFRLHSSKRQVEIHESYRVGKSISKAIPRVTHKTPYDRVKRCRERKINTKAPERVNVDVFTQNKRPCPQHSHAPRQVEQEWLVLTACLPLEDSCTWSSLSRSPRTRQLAPSSGATTTTSSSDNLLSLSSTSGSRSTVTTTTITTLAGMKEWQEWEIPEKTQPTSGIVRILSPVRLGGRRVANRSTTLAPFIAKIQHYENTARQFRALRVEAMAHLKRVPPTRPSAHILLQCRRAEGWRRVRNETTLAQGTGHNSRTRARPEALCETDSQLTVSANKVADVLSDAVASGMVNDSRPSLADLMEHHEVSSPICRGIVPTAQLLPRRRTSARRCGLARQLGLSLRRTLRNSTCSTRLLIAHEPPAKAKLLYLRQLQLPLHLGETHGVCGGSSPRDTAHEPSAGKALADYSCKMLNKLLL